MYMIENGDFPIPKRFGFSNIKLDFQNIDLEFNNLGHLKINSDNQDLLLSLF